MIGRATALCALCVAAIVVSGCGGAHGAAGAARGRTVAITVLRDSAGVGAAAYVPLTIDRHAYIFRVDTGASRTVINASVAAALRLPARGRPYLTGTLGCKASAQPVEVSDWSLGGAALPPTTVSSQRDLIDRPRVDGMPISGLLGSDVLSRFHTVTVNFTTDRLILGAAAPSHGSGIAMDVHRDRQGATFETVRAAIAGASADWLLDTGSPVVLIASPVVARDSLHRLAGHITLHGAVGCTVIASPVAIERWTADGARLPTTVALSSSSAGVTRFGNQRIDGVIGALVLASFDRVTFAFGAGRLVLGPAVSSATGPAGIIVLGAVAVLLVAGVLFAARRRRAA